MPAAKYHPQEIEPKWQKYWEDNNFYRAEDFSTDPKLYVMVEFPYPSGDGLHVGHARSYSALDAIARKKRMEGFNVLYPMGWDAFGLPAENYAIKMGIHPQVAINQNISNFKRQMKGLGISFDWSREINTTDPKYYKWTQWIFLKLLEKGLAYQAEIPINWCPSCKIGLANEEVVAGKCERCGTEAGKKTLKQWMLKITAYADRLIEDLDLVDYPEKVKSQQINWIGKSHGMEIEFKIENSSDVIKVFTTRADTLFGVTAIVLAPENSLVDKIVIAENEEKVNQYIVATKKKSDFEREKLEKEKTGVFTGSYCVNPANNEKIPVWIGDYVIAAYGGGAVMVVPAHDYRDYDFAKKYGLEIKEVVSGGDIAKEVFAGYGALIHSGQFNGLFSEEAIEKISDWLEDNKFGKRKIHYKLRDWVFSRQHYWGEPIPVIHCQKCGIVPVPEKDLPVELPYIEKYQPTGTGESPLANISAWVNTDCPKCKTKARRETDTMPNWAGSNWYYIRYVDPQNDKELADPQKMKYWLPVDWYNGGFEHTTLHLLYSRFIYKFLFDIGVVFQPEPYRKRTSHGIVLAEDSRKMSKSFGNVINPDDVIRDYGADTLRLYEMFMGPFDQMISWNERGVVGVRRFLDRVWRLVLDGASQEGSNVEVLRSLNKLNKKIDDDLEATKFNTAIAAFMEFVNLGLEKGVSKETAERFLVMLAPFAPHLAEELWEKIGHKNSIFFEKWSAPDQSEMTEDMVSLVIQINGRVRDKIEVDVDINEDKAKELAVAREKVKNWLEGKEIKKVIFVPNKLINIVV